MLTGVPLSEINIFHHMNFENGERLDTFRVFNVI